EMMTIVSAPAAITRSARWAMASIDLRTSAIASRPTSGTIIGGCGAMPEKTSELSWDIRTNHRVIRNRCEPVNSRILAPDQIDPKVPIADGVEVSPSVGLSHVMQN